MNGRKASLVFLLAWFLFFPGTLLDGQTPEEEKQLKRIKKCEKIEDPEKREKCQNKILKYLLKEKAGRFNTKSVILRNMDPVRWEKVLRAVAEQTKSYTFRHLALGRLNDQEALYRIVTDTNLNFGERIDSLKYLDDEAWLVKAAAASAGTSIGAHAALKTENQELLIGVLKMEPKKLRFTNLREEAAKRLEDQKALEYLILNDGDEKIREIAVAKVKDPEVLRQVIRTDKSDKVVSAAVKHLDPGSSLDFFRKVQFVHRNIDVKRIARIHVILAEPEIVKIHGPLTLEYDQKFGYKLYGRTGNASAAQETLTLRIRNRRGEVVFEQTYTGMPLGKSEVFRGNLREKKNYAFVGYTAIRNALMKKQ